MVGLYYIVQALCLSDIPEHRRIGEALKHILECKTAEEKDKYLQEVMSKEGSFTALVVESVARSIRW